MWEDASGTISTTIFTTLKNDMLLMSPSISMNAMRAMFLLCLFRLLRGCEFWRKVGMCFSSYAVERSTRFFISGPLYPMDSILSGVSLIFMSDTAECTPLLHGLCLSSPLPFFFSLPLSCRCFMGILCCCMYLNGSTIGFSIFLYGYFLLDPLLFVYLFFFLYIF